MNRIQPQYKFSSERQEEEETRHQKKNDLTFVKYHEYFPMCLAPHFYFV